MTRALPDGVKPTTGPKFDPQAGLTYFLAGDLRSLSDSRQAHVLVAVNEIDGPKDLQLVDRLVDTRNVLLDSGIFNLAMTHAKNNDVSYDDGLAIPPEEIDGFTQLWDRYAQIVDRYKDRLWGVVELDQGGAEHKPRTRARIEQELGIVPMPVYHPFLDGWDYYDTIASSYDRICHANLVKASLPVRTRLIWTAARRAEQYPHLWTHLLGITPNTAVLGIPYKGSCDSSAWLNGVRWVNTWRTWSMLDMFAPFPPDMWYSDRDRGVQILAVQAQAMQLTIDAAGHDTHPWLTPEGAS